MTKTLPCSLKAAHVNHLPGPCQQPKGFNGTVFWDLHMSSVLFKRRRVSRGGREKRDLFECQANERRHGVRQQNSFFSLLILPCQHTQIQTQIVSFSSRDVLCKLEIGLGVWWLNSRAPILNCASSFNRHNTYCYRMQFSFLHSLGSTTVFFCFFKFQIRYSNQVFIKISNWGNIYNWLPTILSK